MSISTFNAGAITSNKTIPEVSSVINEFDGLSAKYVSRKSADNALMLEGGSFTNYLANSFGPTGGGVRVCNSKNSDGTINTDSFYTSYQLSCIRHHTNASTY